VILVVNAGSTSLKLSLVDEAGSSREIDSLAEAGTDVDAVAHRIVHGGTRFREPVLIDAEVTAALGALAELAPLHNRHGVEGIDEAMAVLPDVPHVAVFDTAYHWTMPDEASTYALPARWRGEWGIRRFGFHGLSVEWAAEQVQVPRLVVCHLGGGSSITAVRDGHSVDTTMGYSPLEGVPMATRAGSIDAEIALHLLRTRKLGLEEIEHALEFASTSSSTPRKPSRPQTSWRTRADPSPRPAV
jgi:acetate kinase